MNAMKPILEALDAIILDVEKALEIPKQSAPKSAPASSEASQPASAHRPIAEKKQRKKKEKKPKQPPPQTVDPVVSQFLQCDLRVGKVYEVRPHPEADGLYILQIGYGNDESRTVCAGLRKFISEEEMQNRMVVTICNLKPRTLRGVASQAMILAGSVKSGEGEKETVVPIAPPAQAVEGTLISVAGITGERTMEANKFVSGKTWDKVVARFTVADGKACYSKKSLKTEEGEVTCALPDGAEIH